MLPMVMRRGGKHVMFMGLSQSFTQDVLVPLTLVFEEAGEMTIEVPVDLTRKPAMHGSDHDGAE